jgi:hypothetical protein
VISSVPFGEFFLDYLPWAVGVPAAVCLLMLVVVWTGLSIVVAIRFALARPRGHRVHRWRADP